MGIFNKHSGAQSKQSIATVIAQGCRFSGKLNVENDLRVDGYIEGDIKVNHNLIISEIGRIKGDITADQVIVNGVFDGTCHANKVEILDKGRIQGTVYTDNLCIDSGGKFVGVTKAAEHEKVSSIKMLDKKEPQSNKASNM